VSWRTDGTAIVFDAGEESWSARLDGDGGGWALLDGSGESLVRLASGESYPTAPLAVRIGGTWSALGAPADARFEDGTLTLSWSEPRAEVAIDADSALGLRLRLSTPAADAVTVAFAALPDEHFYGLGERFNKLDQRGELVELWVKNGASGGNTYKPIPFVASSRGYGLAADTSRRVFVSLDHPTTPDVSTLTVEGSELAVWLIPGPAQADIVRRYTAWIGRPPVPPAWFFRPWKSRDWRVEDQQTVLEDISRQREYGIPCGVKLIDATWETEGHSFEFTAEKYPDVPAMIAALQEAGMELVLWISPSMTAGSEVYDEAARRGFLITDASGKPYLHRLGNEPGWEGTTVDFTNPAAVAWWQAGVRRLMELGVRGLKTDFGEQVPEDAIFANGKSGAEMHNLLPVLYNAATWEVVKAYDGALLARSAWAGSQRYPGIWAGDQSADFSPWAGLPSAIVAGLSAGWSGFPYWGSDVGGYFNPPDDEVFSRWAQFGAVSPVMEAHGLGSREAWDFLPQTLEIYRHYAILHDQLLPYSLAAATEARETGLPIMRAMPLLYPEHDEAHQDWAQYQFLYGPALLAAPVYSWGKQRQIWFPPGEWLDVDCGDRFSGPLVTRVPAPIEKLPLYARSGAALPLSLDPDSDALTLRLSLGENPASSSLRLLDGTTITFTPEGTAQGTLQVAGPPRRYRIELPFRDDFTARAIPDPSVRPAIPTTQSPEVPPRPAHWAGYPRSGWRSGGEGSRWEGPGGEGTHGFAFSGPATIELGWNK
jgi:alpha-D-xyloside xylohydrolase